MLKRYKLFREHITDYPQTLSGAEVFRYKYDLVASQLNMYSYLHEEDITETDKEEIAKLESQLEETIKQLDLITKFEENR